MKAVATQHKSTSGLLKQKRNLCLWIDQQQKATITDKDLKEAIKATDSSLTLSQARTAHYNWRNFNQLDRRLPKGRLLNPNKKKSAEIANLLNKPKYQKVNKAIGAIKRKDYTSKEAGTILNEYIFRYKGRVSAFLLENRVAASQFYGWITELTVSGTIEGRRIIPITDRKKCDMLFVINYIRGSVVAKKKFERLSLAERSNINKIKIILEKKL